MRKFLFIFLINILTIFANENVNWVKAGTMQGNPFEVTSYKNQIKFDYNRRTLIVNADNGNLLYDYSDFALNGTKRLSDNELLTVTEDYIATYDLDLKEFTSFDSLKINSKYVKVNYVYFNDYYKKVVIIGFYDSNDILLIWDINTYTIDSYYSIQKNVVKADLIDNNHILLQINTSNDSEGFLKKYEIVENELSLIEEKPILGLNDFTIDYSKNILFVTANPNIDIYDINDFTLINSIKTSNKLTMFYGKSYNKPALKRNSEIIAYNAPDNTIHIYDIINNELLSSFKADYQNPKLFFYDNDYIVTIDEKSARIDLYNYKTGELIHSLVVNAWVTSGFNKSNDDKYLTYMKNTADNSEMIFIMNLENQKIIKSTKIPYVLDYVKRNNLEISSFSNIVLYNDLSDNVFYWNFAKNETEVIKFDNNVADFSIHPKNNEFAVATKNGDVYLMDSLVNIKEQFSTNNNIISIMYDIDGNNIFIFTKSPTDGNTYLYKYSFETNKVEQQENTDLPFLLNGEYYLKKFYNRYFCTCESCYDIENMEKIILPAEWDNDYEDMYISKDLNYVLYLKGFYNSYFMNFNINQQKLSYKYFMGNLYQDVFRYGLDNIYSYAPEKLVLYNENKIIVSLNNGAIMCVDLLDTLGTSVMETYRNESLIADFHNDNNILRIEVDPDINQAINYQITDLLGNTLQKGVLPKGTLYNEIYFYNHSRETYFIMFYNDSGKQIFKFIN